MLLQQEKLMATIKRKYLFMAGKQINEIVLSPLLNGQGVNFENSGV